MCPSYLFPHQAMLCVYMARGEEHTSVSCKDPISAAACHLPSVLTLLEPAHQPCFSIGTPSSCGIPVVSAEARMGTGCKHQHEGHTCSSSDRCMDQLSAAWEGRTACRPGWRLHQRLPAGPACHGPAAVTAESRSLLHSHVMGRSHRQAVMWRVAEAQHHCCCILQAVCCGAECLVLQSVSCSVMQEARKLI